MSKGARFTLAAATLFFGACFLLFALTSAHDTPAGPMPFYGLAAFCFVVATACLSSRSRVVTVPIIASVLVAIVWLENPNALVSGLGILAALLAVPVGLYCYWRWRDRVWLRAVRLSRAGNHEGAVALLQEQLQRDGPSARSYNQFAVLFGVQQNWAEALRMAEEAERLGGPLANVLGTKGMVLWKLGRGTESLNCLREAVRRQPDDLILACNYGSVLAESGRAVEASEMLARAERLFAKQIVLAGAADRQVRKQAVEDLRRKISAMDDMN